MYILDVLTHILIIIIYVYIGSGWFSEHSYITPPRSGRAQRGVYYIVLLLS